MRAPSFKGLRDDKAGGRGGPRGRFARGADAPRAGRQAADVRPRPVRRARAPARRRAGRGDRRAALKITNWDKVLFAETGFTKGDLIAYYARIAPAVLPHLQRPSADAQALSQRGRRPYFYEKQSPSHRPDWVQTTRIGDVNYTLAQDRPTLIWLANLADIELHTSLSLAAASRAADDAGVRPRPGPPAAIVECCEVALVLRGLFAQLGLESVVKTSGSKGMQVYVPLNSDVTYEQTKPFARRIAELLEQRLPELVVSRMTKRLRTGQGAGRLEPERRPQDDGHRLLGTRARAPDRVRPGHLGGGRARAGSRGTPSCSPSTPSRCSRGPTSRVTCSRRC